MRRVGIYGYYYKLSNNTRQQPSMRKGHCQCYAHNHQTQGF
nr:MAG TPA: hypothetical protein [Caudoviricetes sp.]